MIGDLFLIVIWRINRIRCSVKSRVVDGDTSVSKLRQWMPTFQVVVLSFLLKVDVRRVCRCVVVRVKPVTGGLISCSLEQSSR